MLLKSFSGVCCVLIHAVALGAAVISLYLFLASSLERVLVALILLGVAIGLEVVAVLVGDNPTART